MKKKWNLGYFSKLEEINQLFTKLGLCTKKNDALLTYVLHDLAVKINKLV